MKSRLGRFVAIQLGLCLLLMAVWGKPGLDDSYIFLTYARNLAQTGRFAFNPGEVSYGFSSPAYTMLLALVSRITHIPVSVALENILGVLLCALAAAVLWRLWQVLGVEPEGAATLPVALLVSGPWFFTVWFLFGMETGLAVAALLGFLLWLASLRAGRPAWPWLPLGIVSASVLALTRLESGIYIALWLVVAALAMRLRRLPEMLAVGVISGAVQGAWLAFAHRTFGTYMPWTSTARLIYYIPGRFGMESAAQFYHLALLPRLWVTVQAAAYMLFAGPMKLLVMTLPLLLAVWLVRRRRLVEEANARWMLAVAAGCMAAQIVVFAVLFPLAQNRHFAPYIAGLWALVVPELVRVVSARGAMVRRVAVAAVALLWIGGVAQYWNTGHKDDPLRAMAHSGLIQPGDRLAAEPIGILSFETQAHIVDLGGLTDRDAWPMLMTGDQGNLHEVVAWDRGKGANKIVLSLGHCGRWPEFGGYCVFRAEEADAAIDMLRPDQKKVEVREAP